MNRWCEVSAFVSFRVEDGVACDDSRCLSMCVPVMLIS